MRRTWAWTLAAAIAVVPLPAFAAGAGSPGESAPAPSAHELEWLEYGAALERAKAENKHLIIDFYTNWCGWCKRMDRDTYGDSTVAAYLRQNFVLSKVNAESSKPIKTRGGTTTGAQLARDFNVSSFPITWFIRPDGSRIDRLPGYQQPGPFRTVLQFVHERRYEKPQKTN